MKLGNTTTKEVKVSDTSTTKEVKVSDTSTTVELTSIEHELLQRFRSGHLTPPPMKLEDEEVSYIKTFEGQIGEGTRRVGVLFEQLFYAVSEISDIRQARSLFLKEMASKYGVPSNKNWQISVETGELIVGEDNKP